jgi:hypothetical protein
MSLYSFILKKVEVNYYGHTESKKYKVPSELGKDLQTKEAGRSRSTKSQNSESSFADEESI